MFVPVDVIFQESTWTPRCRPRLLTGVDAGPTTPRARMTHADAHSTGGPCAMLSRALICTRQAPWPPYSTCPDAGPATAPGRCRERPHTRRAVVRADPTASWQCPRRSRRSSTQSTATPPGAETAHRNKGPTCLPPITVLAGRVSFCAVGRECGISGVGVTNTRWFGGARDWRARISCKSRVLVIREVQRFGRG